MIEQRSSSLKPLVLKQTVLKPSTTLVLFTSDSTITTNLFRPLKNFTLSFQTVMKSFIKLRMCMNLLVKEDLLSNFTISSLLRYQLTLKFLPKWVIFTNKNKMNSNMSISIRKVIDTIQQRLTSSHVLVCIMLNKTCLKKLFSTSREQLKFKWRRWNGNWWLLLAIEEWICSTKP